MQGTSAVVAEAATPADRPSCPGLSPKIHVDAATSVKCAVPGETPRI